MVRVLSPDLASRRLNQGTCWLACFRMSRLSRTRVSVIALGTMAVATFPLAAYSVLAADLIDEFGILRGQVGLLIAANSLVGALSSPFFGRLTDRLGAVQATRGTFAIAAATLVGMALAPGYGVLVLVALTAGLANGWGNPSTNALIVENLPPGGRGVVTGIKQSGVQVGIFVGGLTLPVLASLWDWRIAVAVFVVVPAVGFVITSGLDRAGQGRPGGIGREAGELPSSIKWLAVYGTISGVATSSMLSFLPLFAEEGQKWSPTAAGSLLAVAAITGVVARIAWPSISERRLGHGRTLRVLSAMTTLSGLILGLAAVRVVPGWSLLAGAVLLGAGAVAWNAVGMLAIMDLAGPGLVGRATGVVLLGFLLGYSAGPPLMGLSVDALGTYAPGWFTTAGLLLLASIVAGRIPAGSTLTAS